MAKSDVSLRIVGAAIMSGGLMSAVAGSGAQADDAAAGCTGREHAWVERLVGTWRELNVSNGVETLIGETVVTQEAGGCAFVQRFVSTHGDQSVSLAHSDADAGGWIERVVFSDGAVVAFLWRESDGTIVVEPIADAPEPARTRIAYTPHPDGFEIVEQASSDGGQTWIDRGAALWRRDR